MLWCLKINIYSPRRAQLATTAPALETDSFYRLYRSQHPPSRGGTGGTLHSPMQKDSVFRLFVSNGAKKKQDCSKTDGEAQRAKVKWNNSLRWKANSSGQPASVSASDCNAISPGQHLGSVEGDNFKMIQWKSDFLSFFFICFGKKEESSDLVLPALGAFFGMIGRFTRWKKIIL